MHSARRMLVLAAALATAAGGACVVPATEVIVTLDSDAPSNRVGTVVVHVLRGSAARDGGAGATLRDRDGGALSLPATFALVPDADEARDDEVTLVVDASLSSGPPGGAAVHVQRTARLRFVPREALRLTVFLSLRCAAAATGCTSVPANACTASVRCAETPGQTCGDDGACVADEVHPGPPLDAACAAGAIRCGAACVASATDPANCGGCGHACGAGEVCAAGACTAPCGAGSVRCASACSDVQTDPANCGVCGDACPPPAGGSATCAAGACGQACPAGQAVCGGACVDPAHDAAHCGACGNACALAHATAACAAGACAIAACAPGFEDIDGRADDGCERQGLGLQSDGLHFRMIDTRPGAAVPIAPGAPLAADATLTVSSVAPSGAALMATAITGTVTVVNPVAGGLVTVYPAADGALPHTTSLNFVAGQTVAAGFTTSAGFKIHTTAPTDVLLDVTGTYGPPGAIPDASYYYYHPLPAPVRVADTRVAGGAIAAGTIRTIQVGSTTWGAVAIPPDIRGVTGWITAASPAAGGHATVFDPDLAQPATSNLSYAAGVTRTADFVTLSSAVPGSAIAVFSNTTSEYVVDVSGYFSAQASDANGAGLLLYPLDTPVRLLDTRGGEACTPGASLLARSAAAFTGAGLTCSGVVIPSHAGALVGNVIAVLAGASGYLYIAPGGSPVTAGTSVTYETTLAANAGFVTGLDARGRYALWSTTATDVVVDAEAYFAP